MEGFWVSNEELGWKRFNRSAQTARFQRESIVMECESGVIIGNPAIDAPSALTVANLTETLERYADLIGYAFERETTAYAGLNGEIDVSFTVDGEGRVEVVLVSDLSLDNDRVCALLERIFYQMEFSRMPGAGIGVTVTLTCDCAGKPVH